MFWKKRKITEEPTKAKEMKLPGPKVIPEVIGRHLVVDLHKDPNWVWNLKCVMRERNGSHIFDARIFDQGAISSRVSVKNYTSLDDHPELILFEGWYNKKTKEYQIKER